MATQSSNKKFYWIIGIIILAIVVVGVGYKAVKRSRNATNMYNASNNYATGTTVAPTTAPTTISGNTGLPNKSDTSNQQLQQDEQSIQNSMNQLQQDQGNSEQDVNNQSLDTPQQ